MRPVFAVEAYVTADASSGLARQQIVGFTWGIPDQLAIGQGEIDRRVKQAADARLEILHGGDTMPPDEKKRKLAIADSAANSVRLYGDLVIAAFFGADKPKSREALRTSYLTDVLALLKDEDGGSLLRLTQAQNSLQVGVHPITPFHWEIEFPEVFGRKRSGFDAIVGNPPFAGKNTLINGTRAGFLDWLKELHTESHGNADLVAHFFRHAFTLLRPNGCFGLIATNTIGQGDTRGTGLGWIRTHGGTIYLAHRRFKWPGQAAVVVSVVHIAKCMISGQADLDGKTVGRISAYLFHGGSDQDPARLAANLSCSFQGSIVLGMGFTFDDSGAQYPANSISVMHDLVRKNPKNSERILPYIGGEEVNNSPSQAYHRFIINFASMSEEEANQWPDLFDLIRERVKPQRDQDNPECYRRLWWQYAEKRVGLELAVRAKEKVLATNCGATPHLAISVLDAKMVFANTLAVFTVNETAGFPLLQCRAHEVWARFFASTMKDDLRYTPTDCFETFPFPTDWEGSPRLVTTGREYYDFRADLMVQNNEGLTKTYNRFHDPDEVDPDIIKLRELHSEMDRAVLDAYGWPDIPTNCDFFLEYEDDEEEDDGRARRRKKPWRYRWPDEVRDEVLARLLELNAKRAEEEKLAGMAAEPAAKTRIRKAKPGQGGLPGM